MKNSAFGKQVDHVERLGDLARHGRVNEQVVDRLHDEWQADFERMNDEEREQLYREMSAATAAQGEREDDPEVIRAWEEYQNSLERMSLASQSSSLSRNWATREYVFHDNNPFLESSNPYQEGVALYGAGKLNEAILAFEAALKANMKDSNCWRLLGTCYAENDDDVAALVPLRKVCLLFVVCLFVFVEA
jgi:Flp pilus assembly protein TadD